MDLFSTNFTEEELYKLNIHELRDIARQIGVQSPTTKKKEELVSQTLQIVYGDMPKSISKTGAGRPVRTKNKPSRIVYDLQNQSESGIIIGDNIFTSQYVENPENIFISSNVSAKKVASPKADYLTGSAGDDYISFSDEGSTIWVQGVAVTFEDGLALEVEDDSGVKSFSIDNEMTKAYSIEAGDVIEAFVSTKYKMVTSLSSINGEFII